MSIRAMNLIQSFGDPPTEILHGITLEIRDGEFIALTGRSGSGKSTLLYILSTLDAPKSGELYIDEKSVSKLTSSEIHGLRNQSIGFVFQFHHLLPELTALENVLMPARKPGRMSEFRPHAELLLKKFGLAGMHDRFPRQLSGGEQQRVAIARALVMKPRYVFADEPTGNLDSTNGKIVIDLLKEINQTLKTTIVMVTHDPEFAQAASRRIHLVDGKVQKAES